MKKYVLFIFTVLFTMNTAMAKDNLNGQQFLLDEEGNIDIIYTVKNGCLEGEYVSYNIFKRGCMPRVKITSINNKWHYEIYGVNCTPVFIGTSPRKTISLNGTTIIEGYGTIFQSYGLKNKIEDITTIQTTGNVKITIYNKGVINGIYDIGVMADPI